MTNGNGNGTVPNESNPISPYIRPLAAIFFGIVGLLLVAAGGFAALKSGNWQIFFGLTAVALVPILWFFNIRGGEKAISKMVDMFEIGTSVGTQITKNDILPKANGGQATSTDEDAWSVVEEPQFGTWDGKSPIAFDALKFEGEIKRDTVGQYGEENPATLFYEALTKIEGVAAPWHFNNLQALKDCRKFILGLAEKAFVWKWGVSYDDAVLYLNDPKGCTTCSAEKQSCCTWPDIDYKARQLDTDGLSYYFILRLYREAKQKVADLEE